MNLNKKNVKYLNLTIGLAITLCFQAALAQGLKIPGMGQPSGTGTSTGSPIAPSVGSSKTGLRASSSQVDAVAPTPETQKEGATSPGQTPSGERDKEYSDFIVAIVDSEPITNREVNVRALEHLEQMRLQGTVIPPKDSLLSKTLEELILEKAQLQLALESGITVNDEELLQAQLGIAERNSITLEQLYAQIKDQGQTIEQYKIRLKQQIILQKLRERDVLSRLRISDLEADQYILEQQKKGSSATQLVNVSQILIAIPDGTGDAQLEPFQVKANQVLQRIKAGEDFSELAKTTSEAMDAKNGGSMGLRAESRYPTLFINAVKNIKPGQVVGPIRSGAGLHILKLIDRQQVEAENSMVTQTHARHILIRPGGQVSQNSARAQLSEFKRRIEKGETNFAELAKQYSQDASASAGGDLGWAAPGQFVPEFEAVLSQLTPGQIADPLVSRFGVHLIQLIERKQAPISQKDRRENAKKQMQEKKFEESYTTWERELRGRAFIEYRDPPV